MTTLDFINASRDEFNRPPLKRSRILAAYARAHSKRMAKRGDLFHSDLNVELPRSGSFLELPRSGSFLGENVGVTALGIRDNTTPAERLHDAFMASPGHRANILSPRFRRIGVGAASNRDAIWLTEVFFG
jgi:uncharacterized protein YkwD